MGIDIWIRQETQDEAFERDARKAIARAFFYRLIYSQLAGAFYIGNLNRRICWLWLKRGQLFPHAIVRGSFAE